MTMEQKTPRIETEIERELFRHLRKSLKEKPLFLKNPIARLDTLFNFYPEQYILLGSITGTGKTSLIDHCMLAMLDQLYDAKLENDIHVEFLYYSMERKKKIKYAKFISWKMFKEEKIRISTKQILNRENTMKESQLEYIITNYEDWLEKILSHVDIREGAHTLETISKDVESKARQIGIYYHSDENHIYKFGDWVGDFDDNVYVMTKYGKRKYADIKVNGQTYTIYENDKIFVHKKPTLFFIILDHIGKIKRVKGLNKKETLDAADEKLCEYRDNYLMSPIAISQFNRSISATDRLKYAQGDLDPVLEDFKDTGNMTESADLVLSVFNPGRYKSWDSKGNYKGYNIRDAMVTPSGKQRARSLHILKNSLDTEAITQILRFTGESMYFEAMPVPEDEEGIQRVYNEILQGK